MIAAHHVGLEQLRGRNGRLSIGGFAYHDEVPALQLGARGRPEALEVVHNEHR